MVKVYNFEVEDNHSYFVGEGGVLVHNYGDLGFLYNQIMEWESMFSGNNDATAVKEKAEECGKTKPYKCAAEYYQALAKTGLKASGGLSVSVTKKLGTAVAPYAFATILSKPATYHFWKAAASLDYNFSLGLDDSMNGHVTVGVGKGPIDLSYKLSVDQNGVPNRPVWGIGITASPRQKVQINHDGTVELNNRTVLDIKEFKK